MKRGKTMELILIFFIMLWLIAPVVLTILYIVALTEKSSLKKQNITLKNQINELQQRLSQSDKVDVLPVSEPTPVVQKEEVIPDKRVAPQYNLYKDNAPLKPVAEQKPSEPAPEKIVAEPIPQKVVAEKQVAPKPAEIRTEPAPQKKTSAMNIILILGALFLCLSGFIFAAATWGVLNTFFKTVVLLSFSAFFFGMHSLTERKLKLAVTGRVFYIVGSLFLPAAFVAAGILGVFGEYLSFSGDGCLLMMAITTFSFCIPFFKGGYDYKSKILASVSHYSFSATVFLLLLHFIPRADVAILVNAVYSFAVVIAEPLIIKLYNKLFGDDNVFSEIYSYFAVISVTILSILSNFVFIDETMSIVTLFAFAIYGVAFLTRTVSQKNEAFSVSFFALFITISLFTGFDPDNFSSVILIITLMAVIYCVLSFMGIFPEKMKKILEYFGIAVAVTAGILAAVDYVICLAEETIPLWQTIISSFIVTAEFLILSIRHKTNGLKALTFGAFIWSVTGFVIAFDIGFVGNVVIPFVVVLAYYIVTSLTPLKKILKPVITNDILFGTYAVISSFICSTDSTESRFISIAMLIVSAITMIICNRGKVAEIFCPIFTFQLSVPLFALINFSFDIENSNLAMCIILVLFCLIASVLVFIPKAKNYALSYGFSLLFVISVFLISCCIWESADFIPMFFVIGYSVVFFIKHSLPNRKYGDINIVNTAVILTSFIIGFRYLDDLSFIFCFPAIVLMVIFAFSVLSTVYKAFPNVNKPIGTFLWYSLPVTSSLLMISGCVADNTSLVAFGTVLAICAGVVSVFRKNTLALILPVLILPVSIAILCEADMLFIPLIMLVIAGRILFREKLFNGVYSDVFSSGAFIPALIYIFKSMDDDLKVWFGILLLALLTLNIIRREHSSFANRMCISVAGAFIFPLFWLQPFCEIPEFINVQFNLMPVFFYCLLIKYIWKDHPNFTDNFSFTAAIISLVILFAESVSGDSFDAVFIGIFLFIMLFVSFIIKRKRWFVLAVSSMVVSGIVLSFGQKDSIAWLIYLALAGVTLIAMGLANEFKKQQQRTGEETKLSRFMSDWTW